MPAGLALLLLAPAASATSYGPAAPPPVAKPAAVPAPPADPNCERPANTPDNQRIVVCAVRPDGYRLNPDVMEARREIHSGGRPTRPGPMSAVPNNCTIGPTGCGPQAGINLLAAGITAVTMVRRLTEGKEIGSMFRTDPHPSEYQLYLEAKARREADAADRVAAARERAKEAEATAAARMLVAR